MISEALWRVNSIAFAQRLAPLELAASLSLQGQVPETALRATGPEDEPAGRGRPEIWWTGVPKYGEALR